MNKVVNKAPRIFGDYDLSVGQSVILNADHCHYLLSVMRKDDGDKVRIFNGRDGDFVGSLVKTSKKSATLQIEERLRPFHASYPRIHLYFAPIKKDRLVFLIEKAVELGVTDLHPVLTDHTENRNYKEDKMHAYIIEAAEQCERLDVPTLHAAMSFHDLPNSRLYVALERADAPLFLPQKTDEISILIGPEGGWSAQEVESLQNNESVIAVSLGSNILRAETAALFMLARIDKSE